MSTILITGASRGIGLETARQFAMQEGWRVHASCRRPASAKELDVLRRRCEGRLAVHQLDVTDPGQIRSLAEALRDESIDILLNNAGVYGEGQTSFGHADESVWLDVLRVNTIAPLRMAEAFVGHVARSQRRIIATVSSRMGSIDDNGSGGYYPYRSSKAGVNMVMRSLARDLAPRRIIAVALSPGWVRTEMGGPQAPLSPERSVSGLRKVLTSLTLRDSGRFLEHDGAEVLW